MSRPVRERLHHSLVRGLFLYRELFRGNYERVAGSLVERLDFDTVLDLGCGRGFLLESLLRRGKDVRGVELSAAVVESVRPPLRGRVTVGSATSCGKLGEFDLVVCTEVAEHVPRAAAAELLDTIAANARRWVFFTAATPCQPGLGHVHLRPQFFWLNELRKRGLEPAWEETERVAADLDGLRPARWLAWNALVLVRRDAA